MSDLCGNHIVSFATRRLISLKNYHSQYYSHVIFFSANTNAICGNRIKEEGEECDCGWESECTEGCCNPQTDTPGTETPCTRKSTAVCRYQCLVVKSCFKNICKNTCRSTMGEGQGVQKGC